MEDEGEEKVLNPSQENDDVVVEELSPKASETINNFQELDASDKEQVMQVLIAHKEKTEYYEGPFPHPSILQGYKDVSPDFPKQIMDWTKSEQQFRHDFYQQEQKNQNSDSKAGILSAVIVCLVCIICGTIIILNGHQLSGTLITAFGPGSVVVSFLTTTRPHHSDSSKDDEDNN